jgi:hypothetical protein
MSEDSGEPRLSLREGELPAAPKSLAEILDGLPVAPGVYIM